MTETVCPATMCPLMGLDENGSPWTGSYNSPCESDCGWNRDGSCIVTGELIMDLLDGDEIPDGEWPACEFEEQCQWQQELPDGVPCPPRLAVLLNEDPANCLF